MGAIILQGPHHSAQKSSNTGLSDLRTSWLNVASVVCTMCELLTRFILHWRTKNFGFRERNLRLGPVINRGAAAKAVPDTPVKRLHCDLYGKEKLDGRWGSFWPRSGLLSTRSH